MPNITHSPKPANPESDLDAVRRYMRGLGHAFLESADSVNPLVTGLGLAIAERLGLGLDRKPAARMYCVTCPCGKQLELRTTVPFRCGYCGQDLEIECKGGKR
jgi:hypothetical protein